MTRRSSVIIVLMVACRVLSFADDGLSLSQPLTGKFLHVLGGMASGLAAAGIVEVAVDPSMPGRYPWLLPMAALAGSVVAGVSKEILDSTGFGDPEFTDILITSTGGIAAALIVGYAQSVYPGTQNGQMNGASFVFSLATLIAMPVINGFLLEIRRYEARRSR